MIMNEARIESHKIITEFQGNMKMKFTPAKNKMTDIGKRIVRYMCLEKPWRQFMDENSFDLVFDVAEDKSEYIHSQVECLFGIYYESVLNVGGMELSSSAGSPIFGYMSTCKDGIAEIRLQCEVSGCEKVFTDYLTFMCDELNAWDEICTRKEE